MNCFFIKNTEYVYLKAAIGGRLLVQFQPFSRT